MNDRSKPSGDFYGVWPVMLTPFKDDGAVDWAGLDALTDWYMAQGATGLFAVCFSSEMFDLTAEERIGIAERVVRRVDGRVPVVASGGFGDTLQEQVQSVKTTAATGVNAVVLATSLPAEESEPDETWRERTERILSATGEIPMGLYECPAPYRRLLSPRLIDWAGAAGRFVFYKDTSCDGERIRQRAMALTDTPARLFNANMVTLLASFHDGVAGYCSCAANFYPELLVRLYRIFEQDPEEARLLHRWLTIVHPAAMTCYPRGAKAFLADRGVPIGETCRRTTPELNPEQHAVLHVLREAAEAR